MKHLLILIMIFSIVPMQAKKTQQITNMHQIFNAIGRTANDILSFAKSTLEEQPSEQQEISELFLRLPGESIESNNKLETIGKYLNATSDKTLRARIKKNPAIEGSVLLSDFFKTVMHKALRKKIEALVSVMTSCTFLAPEEGKILRELKIFYPENYDNSAYSWEPSFKNGNVDILVGRLHKLIGLKQSLNNWSNHDDLEAIIDVTYTCGLRHEEKRIACFKGAVIKNIGPRFKAYVEPQHNMTVSITFLRTRFVEGSSAVTYRCHAFGGERIFSAAENIQHLQKNYWLGNTQKPPLEIEDIQESAYGPFISEEFVITSAESCVDWWDLVDQRATDFIIPITQDELDTELFKAVKGETFQPML